VSAEKALIGTLVAIALILPTAHAQVLITEAWASKPVSKDAVMTAAFMCIENDGSFPIQVVEVSSPIVNRIEIHRIQHQDGIVRMRRVNSIDVAAKQKVCLKPDGLHLMLIGLDEVVYTELDIPLKIKFASGDVVQTVLVQRSLFDDSRQSTP